MYTVRTLRNWYAAWERAPPRWQQGAETAFRRNLSDLVRRLTEADALSNQDWPTPESLLDPVSTPPERVSEIYDRLGERLYEEIQKRTDRRRSVRLKSSGTYPILRTNGR